ncbi:diacylglycerol kinase DgkA [Peptoclostridium acidaminophilum DSM 3953]|uniref:Diacylglycerol kinase DgkA n=1 Tax=Peptoclostridium acidaminophilum DSM 3953 TaxID=1286171 RepID=W8TFX3_PEPAC|nr:diacylglycerol kinase [Peptoclostridium acidaminophilum]AHM56723.1 diacylglycerol kinase DgkA [Peptoclostridium acidaminophilum DSM 3953]
MKNKSISSSFDNAIKGIIVALRSERNLRLHIFAAAIAVMLSILLGLSKLEIAAVLFSISLVISLELVNTAIEKAVDLFTSEYSEMAGFVKDVSAAAVMVAAINAAAIGYLVFFDKLLALPLTGLDSIIEIDINILIIALAINIALVIGLKLFFKRGSYIKGGFPSGHSAVAFSVATAIAMSEEKLLASALAFVLALIVSESRVHSNIHTRMEAVAGAAIGILITVILFKLLR